ARTGQVVAADEQPHRSQAVAGPPARRLHFRHFRRRREGEDDCEDQAAAAIGRRAWAGSVSGSRTRCTSTAARARKMPPATTAGRKSENRKQTAEYIAKHSPPHSTPAW